MSLEASCYHSSTRWSFNSLTDTKMVKRFELLEQRVQQQFANVL